MINVDDRILSEVNENEFWLIMHVAKRMRWNRMTAWPAIETIAADTKWSVNTARKWRDSLVEKKLISIEYRTGKSPIYTFLISGIGLYTPMAGTLSEENELDERGVPVIAPLPNIGTPPLPNIGTPPLPNIGTPPLPNIGTLSILEIKELKKEGDETPPHSQSSFTLPVKEEKKQMRESANVARAPRKVAPPSHTPKDVYDRLCETGSDYGQFFRDIWKVWADYLEHREEIKVKKYASAKSEALAVIALHKISGGNAPLCKRIVEQSRYKQWIGLLPIKEDISAEPQQKPQQSRIPTYG